jgi:hypothetical protein
MNTTICAIILSAITVSSSAEAGLTRQSVTVSILDKGVHCDDCAGVLRAALGKVKGVRFDGEAIKPAPAPKYRSEPFDVKILDPGKTQLGDLARAVGAAKTPHRSVIHTGLTLILYWTDAPEAGTLETLISGFRAELRFVTGVDAQRTGALGAIPDRGYVWLDLGSSGGSDLEDIMEAAMRAGFKLATQKQP